MKRFLYLVMAALMMLAVSCKNGTGVSGKIVTASNGNSIFLPAAAYRSDTFLNGAGSFGDYWSSSLSTDYPRNAWNVYFNSVNLYRSSSNRYYGLTVCLVCEE